MNDVNVGNERRVVKRRAVECRPQRRNTVTPQREQHRQGNNRYELTTCPQAVESATEQVWQGL